MKKYLALFLALIMVLALAACGGGTPAASDTPTSPANTPSSPTPGAAPA